MLISYSAEWVFWGTSTWKFSCHINTAVNTFILPRAAETFLCVAATGIVLRHSTSQKQMSAQAHFSLHKRLVGWGKQGDREPSTAMGPLPGQEWRSLRASLGWSPSMAVPFLLSLRWRARGVWDPSAIQVCFQLSVHNNSTNFPAPAFCSCSRVSPY